MTNWIKLFKKTKAILEYAKKNNLQVLIMNFRITDFTKNTIFLNPEERTKYVEKYHRYLKEEKNEEDLVFKISEEEFICIVPDTPKNLKDIEKNLIKNLNFSLNMGKVPIGISCSIGSCLFPKDGTSEKELIENARIARLYKAPNAVKNFHKFTKQDRKDAELEFKIKQKISEALINNEIKLHYQPIISLETQKIVSVEALLRWKLDGKILNPLTIVEIAEENEFIHKIGEWIIKETCKQNAVWRKNTGKNIPISINISRSQFSNPKLPLILSKNLLKYNINPKFLKIEATETTKPKNFSSITNINISPLEIFKEIKNMNIRIYLDDFGTGHANSTFLNSFPFTGFKVDKVFIDKLFDKKDSTLEMVTHFLHYAKQKNLEVICEGVETKKDCQLIKKIYNKALIQGWVFSKAVPAKEIETMIIEDKSFS